MVCALNQKRLNQLKKALNDMDVDKVKINAELAKLESDAEAVSESNNAIKAEVLSRSQTDFKLGDSKVLIKVVQLEQELQAQISRLDDIVDLLNPKINEMDQSIAVLEDRLNKIVTTLNDHENLLVGALNAREQQIDEQQQPQGKKYKVLGFLGKGEDNGTSDELQ